MQTQGGGDVPLTVENIARVIDGDDVAGGDLVPGQFPGIGQHPAVTDMEGDVPGDVLVPALLEQHAAHEGHLGLFAQFRQQGFAPRIGGEGFQYVVVGARYASHGRSLFESMSRRS